MTHKTLMKTVGVAALVSLGAGMAAQAQTILTTGNGIVRNSLCVGGDCQTGIGFSDSTIILKENNTRIKFADTSASASFPREDWELEANSPINGGANRFAIFSCGEGSNDGACSDADNVFTVEANARSNALYVESSGEVGIGTANPVGDIHIVIGDTPTVRLEQNTSSGFTAQTWDLAGNETNFFIRDVTNGSKLPFRTRPGAPTSSIDIAANGNVGFGDASPDAALDVRRTGTRVTMELEATTDDSRWQMIVDSDNDPNAGYSLTRVGSGTREFRLTPSGDLIITGEITTTGSCSVGCDAVFGADHTLSSIEDHAALMWENKYLPNVGPTSEEGPYNMSDKVLRMLNELEHAHIYIEQLNIELKAQSAEIDALKAKVSVQ